MVIEETDDDTLTKIIICNQIAIDRILQTKMKNDELLGAALLQPLPDSVTLRDGRILYRSPPYKSIDDDVIKASSSSSSDPLGLKDPETLKDHLGLKKTNITESPAAHNGKSSDNTSKSVTDKIIVPSGPAEKRTIRSKSMPEKNPGPVKRKRELSLSLLTDDKEEEGECSPVGPQSIKLKCWGNCSSSGVVFNLNSFIAHLNCTHGTPSHDPLPSHQQIVCTCSVCEAVVLYNYEHKDIHVKKCPDSAGVAQFFLFLENNRDNFGVPHFNAPMLKSQGVSVSEQFSINCKQSEMDTILWRTTDNVLFFYHYCQPCNHFLCDRKSEVVAHLQSNFHCVNMRKRKSHST